jgi:hypothetical protein
VLVDIEANTIDTNPHERRRTYAMRQQEKYAYLQEFLNVGEHPRHHRSVIPLNGVSRVRIPPPPLFILSICRTNTQGTQESYRSSNLFDTNLDEVTTYRECVVSSMLIDI